MIMNDDKIFMAQTRAQLEQRNQQLRAIFLRQ